MTQNKNYFGRESQVNLVKKALEGENKINSETLSILSIEGLGGIGKTTLFNYAKREALIDKKKYLELSIGGTSFNIKSGITKALKDLISSAKYKNHKTKKIEKLDSKFIESTELISAYNDLTNDIAAEDKKTDNGGKKANLSRLYFEILLPMGEKLNSISPVTKQYLDASSLPTDEKSINEIFNSIEAISTSSPTFIEKLGIQSNASKIKRSIQTDFLDAIASSLYNDILSILYKYPDSSWYSPKPSKNENTDNLLMCIDDFEYSGALLRVFLTDHFLPKLKQAPFDSLVVIIGRDQIENTSPTWNRNFGGNFLKPIRLKFLSKDELAELIENSIDDVDAQKNIDACVENALSLTEGHPLLVQMWIDEFNEGELSATSLKRFYDRITQWMDENQKDWLQHCVFCDQINLDFFRRNLKLSELEAAEALTWFESEGSIRDNRSNSLRVNKFVKSRVSNYLKITNPALHDKLESKYNNTIKHS